MDVDPKSVQSREEFVKFLKSLRQDLEEERAYWQNTSLDVYLDSMAYWIEERMPEMYDRYGKPMPGQETWAVLANLMYMAAIYE